MPEPIRVVVGEDSFLMREGILGALAGSDRIEVVGAEGDLDALRETIERTLPDVVVSDRGMPPTGTNEGILLAVELGRTRPEIGVVVLAQGLPRLADATDLFDHGNLRRAYILKERIADGGMLIDAVESVARGTPVIDPGVIDVLVEGDGAGREPGIERLTPREREVLALVAEGASNAAIARALVITTRAVERHVNSIFAKLDLADDRDVNRRVLAAMMFMRSVPR